MIILHTIYFVRDTIRHLSVIPVKTGIQNFLSSVIASEAKQSRKKYQYLTISAINNPLCVPLFLQPNGKLSNEVHITTSVIPATERQVSVGNAYREGRRESILYALQADEIGVAMQ